MMSLDSFILGSPTVVKSFYTLIHTVCVALRCMVLPEIILIIKLKSIKLAVCQVKSTIDSSNRLKITGENDSMQICIL